MRCLLFLIILVTLTGCQFLAAPTQEDPQALAETMVAQTATAASPTPPPTDTPVPTDTLIPPTFTPSPTYTPVPSDTPTLTFTPTETPIPTDTPTPTVTPGPLIFNDDFSAESDSWDCPGCRWESGQLFAGPYAPGTNPGESYPIICEACGTPMYYRIAVDVTFVEGYGLDRGFGLLISMTDEKLIDLEITTGQLCIIWEYTFSTNAWKLLNRDINQVWNGLVKPGYATNRLEVVVQPSGQVNTADYYINLNGKTSFVIYTRPVRPSQVGLMLGWHSVGVAYDNWEFEEIEP